LPFNANKDRRHRIPRHRVTIWAEHEEGLRARGSLTVWFTEEAIEGWRAAVLFGPGDRHGADPACRVSSGAAPDREPDRLDPTDARPLLGLDLAVPDHSTLSRRAETREVPWPRGGQAPVHLLVDSTGLKLCGPGEWLVEKHGTRTRRGWRKLHLATDADTGWIVASELTAKDTDDGSQVDPLLDQLEGPVASFTGDGAYDRNDVYVGVAAWHPDADIIVPPRSSAVPSETAETAPTQCDAHLQLIAERGRTGWQRASGYNYLAFVESDISRWKRVIGDGLRS
jgi:hypothetical protein